MGTLTLVEFQTEILAALGNRTEDSVSLARLVAALNLSQARLSRAHPFSEMSQVSFSQTNFTGTPGIDKYLVPPADLRTLHSFVLLDTENDAPPALTSRKLVERPWRWFDRMFPAPEATPSGWPSIYTRWGNFIVMMPPPFKQFTAMLRYVSRPTAFTVGVLTQSSDFQDKDDILINYTLAYFFKALGRADRAAYFEALGKEQLDEAIAKDDERPDIEVSHDIAELPSATEPWADPFVRGAL